MSRWPQSAGLRLFSAVFGVLLLGSAGYLLRQPGLGPAELIAVLLLGALGLNLLWSAWRGRESWLSRIGPLP